jgi:hypothetical protein
MSQPSRTPEKPFTSCFKAPFPWLVFSLLLLCTNASANFDFNRNCLLAYQRIFELKLGTAKVLIDAEKKLHPDNSIVPLLENYLDYFTVLTTDSKAEFDRLKDFKSDRLEQISDDQDHNSPYYLYAQAEINLQWALMRGRFGEYFTAAREINKANSLLLDNKKKFPSFSLNSKGLGVINAFLGNLPDGMLKSTLSTFGIKGDLASGTAMLDNLAENLPRSSFEPFFEEVIFYYSFVLSDVAKSPAAYSKVMKYTLRIPDSSLLKTYIQAYVCSRSSHNEETIRILSSRPVGKAYQPFAYLDLLMGTALLNKLDYTAQAYLQKFLTANKGVSYIKDANLHLAWISLLKGDKQGYKAYLSKVNALGYTYNDKDKQAVSEAAGPLPNLILLKARLLFDGGYFDKALSTMETLDREPCKAQGIKQNFTTGLEGLMTRSVRMKRLCTSIRTRITQVKT